MKKPKYEKPACPKCKKEMRLVSTGELVRRFECEACKEILIVKRAILTNGGFKE